MAVFVTLSAAQASCAAAIQEAIDRVASAPAGGVVELPAVDLTLDRGLQLRSHVTLRGQGEATILRKGPGRVWPMSGYHNYGMCDVPLVTTAGLEVGMTVSVHDSRTHGGFYETFATITCVDTANCWVGLDHGIEADYIASDHPCLTTSFPVIFGHNVESATIENLHIEGSADNQNKKMGGCRGGAVYFAKSYGVRIKDVTEADYDGEGLSFQMYKSQQ